MKITIVVVCLLGAVAAAEAGLRGAASSPDHPASENADSCALKCKRLRFVGRKQDECVDKCLLDNDASEGRSINHIDGGDDGEEDENEDPESASEDSASACALRCKRLRFVGRKQDECVERCLVTIDTSEAEGRSINHIDGGDDGEEDENEDPESESEGTASACALRCKRLRFVGRKQDECVERCLVTIDASEGRSINHIDGGDDGEQDESEDPESESEGTASACALRCKRLRFVGRKQDECVERCLVTIDASEGRSINHIDGGDDGDQDENEDPEGESEDTPSACALRCKRLRFVGRKQDECVDKCLLDNDASEGRSINHIDGGDDGEEDENEDPEGESEDTASACALRCKRLRFVGRKQDECVDKCLEERPVNEVELFMSIE